MMVHPIDGNDVDRFVNYSTDQVQNELLRNHLQDTLGTGATTERWCLVADRDGRWIGRVFLSGPAGLGEVFVHFFDVALDQPNVDQIAHALLSAALNALPPEDERTLVFALDEGHPWHPDPERRRRWFNEAGFQIARRTRRWEWPRNRRAPTDWGRLRFRDLDEVGEDAFREAMARVSDGTLDSRLQEMRERLGREADAAEHFRLLTTMRHMPSWLQLGFDRDGNLVGLFAVGGAVGEAFVAFVGVVPEMRGQRYVDELLARATALLLGEGEDTIRADTDVDNEPMAKAFERAGYVNFMTRTDFTMSPHQRRVALNEAAKQASEERWSR